MSPLFVVLLGVTLLVSMAANRRFRAVRRETSATDAGTGLTGGQAALRILEAEGLEDVRVMVHPAMLGDAYDAGRRQVVLCERTHAGTSASAVALAAHVTAHALQHRDAFTALSFRLSALKLAQVGSGLVLALAGCGLLLHWLTPRIALLLVAAAWGVILILNIMSLPVEFDASARAEEVVRRLGLARGRAEREAVGRMLGAAAIGELRAIVLSVPYLVYHLLPLFGRRARPADEW